MESVRNGDAKAWTPHLEYYKIWLAWTDRLAASFNLCVFESEIDTEPDGGLWREQSSGMNSDAVSCNVLKGQSTLCLNGKQLRSIRSSVKEFSSVKEYKEFS